MPKNPEQILDFKNYCADLGIKPTLQETTVLVNKKKIKPPTPHKIVKIFNDEVSSYNLLEDPLYHDKYCNNGQKQVIKNLRSGKYKIIKTLDLHHFRQNEAILKLESFIDGNITPGNTCLKIIHGKGLNSLDGKAVLRSIVRRFLEYHSRLIAYTNAEERDGGDGTTLVKLKN